MVYCKMHPSIDAESAVLLPFVVAIIKCPTAEVWPSFLC